MLAARLTRGNSLQFCLREQQEKLFRQPARLSRRASIVPFGDLAVTLSLFPPHSRGLQRDIPKQTDSYPQWGYWSNLSNDWYASIKLSSITPSKLYNLTKTNKIPLWIMHLRIGKLWNTDASLSHNHMSFFCPTLSAFDKLAGSGRIVTYVLCFLICICLPWDWTLTWVSINFAGYWIFLPLEEPHARQVVD